MNKALIVLASVVIAGSAFAGEKTISCAVMKGSKVDIAKATKSKMFADYKGRRYFFCCAGCPEAFKKDPAKYSKNASIPTPKSK